MDARIKIGNKIKELRKKKGLSQQELSEILGYESDTAVYSIEKGRSQIPIDKLKKLSDFFKIPISDLIGEKKTSEDKVLSALRAKELTEDDIEYLKIIIDSLRKRNGRKKRR